MDIQNKINVTCLNCNKIQSIPVLTLSKHMNKIVSVHCNYCAEKIKIRVDASLLNQKSGDAGKVANFETFVLDKKDNEKNAATSMASLHVLDGELTGSQTLDLALGENFIGRYPTVQDENKVTIISSDRKISRTHCVISVEKNNDKFLYYLKDNSSTNGTYYTIKEESEKKMDMYQEIILDENVIIRLGSTKIKLIHNE